MRYNLIPYESILKRETPFAPRLNQAFTIQHYIKTIPLTVCTPICTSIYSVEQKNGVRGCYRGGSCWHTFFSDNHSIYIYIFPHCAVKPGSL